MPGDEIVGYVSLGRGITIHREDCKNVVALKRAPERFTEVAWEGDNEASYRVELQVDAYDRTRLLEDLSRTFAEAGVNILEASCSTKHPMVKNRFVVEVGDTQQLKQAISPPAPRRVGLRRLPGHARRLSAWSPSTWSSRRAARRRREIRSLAPRGEPLTRRWFGIGELGERAVSRWACRAGSRARAPRPRGAAWEVDVLGQLMGRREK